jgi:hypothetical protein
MIATGAGIASNGLTSLRSMVISQPNASPSVKRPGGLTCLTARCRGHARTQTTSTPVPLPWRFSTMFLVSPLTSLTSLGPRGPPSM